MECVWASFERLAVRGEAGLACEEAVNSNTSPLTGGTYESSLIKLHAKLEASILLLNNQVSLDSFTVDVVVAREGEDEEDEREEGGGGVFNFIQERLVGSKKSRPKTNLKNGTKDKSEAALTSAWEVCRAKGYHSLYALAKITPETLPNNLCRERYTAGQYAEALLGGCRAYFMFQRHNPRFEADALGLWVDGGAGCVSGVDLCYLVLGWRLNEQETVRKVSPLSLFNSSAVTALTAPTPVTAPAPAAPLKQGRKRVVVTQNEERSHVTPPRKRTRTAPQTPPPPVTAHRTEEEEEEEEEEDITLSKQQASAGKQTPPSPVKVAPPRPPGRPPANQRQEPASPTNHKQPSPPTQVTQEAEDDLSDITFGFERSTPRGRGRGRGRRTSTTTTPRKSVLLPQWSEEEKEELLGFFDTLNPSQTEQTCIALACKFATMRFGRELPSKQLYQWVQQKNRMVHPRPAEYTLPGGDAGVRTTAAELYRSLNQDVSESKRVAFTCRFLQTQYGVELSSKELYNILSGGGKKRGGRAR